MKTENRRPGRYARRQWKRMRHKRGQWLRPSEPSQDEIREMIRAGLAGPRAQSDLIAGEAERRRMMWQGYPLDE